MSTDFTYSVRAWYGEKPNKENRIAVEANTLIENGMLNSNKHYEYYTATSCRESLTHYYRCLTMPHYYGFGSYYPNISIQVNSQYSPEILEQLTSNTWDELCSIYHLKGKTSFNPYRFAPCNDGFIIYIDNNKQPISGITLSFVLYLMTRFGRDCLADLDYLCQLGLDTNDDESFQDGNLSELLLTCCYGYLLKENQISINQYSIEIGPAHFLRANLSWNFEYISKFVSKLNIRKVLEQSYTDGSEAFIVAFLKNIDNIMDVYTGLQRRW